MVKLARVACDCNGLRLSGTYRVDGDWLVLHSPLGEHRVRLGLGNPRKLAARLMKNLCLKAAAGNAPRFCARDKPSVGEKAQQLVDLQRDRLVAMASNDPARSDEERALDQLLINARVVDSTSTLLDPQRDPADVAGLPPQPQPDPS